LTFVYKENCTVADCDQRPRNLAVEYTTDCEALLEWIAPTDVLWDNNNPAANYGHMSCRWMMADYPRFIVADDFIVGAGEKWVITEIYSGGFYQTSDITYEKPDYIGIEIFEDDGGKPGQQIFEDYMLTPISGSLAGTFTVLFPEPFEISTAGKYWVAIYGVFESDYDNEKYEYVIYHSEDSKGSDYLLFDDAEGSWERPGSGSSPYRSLSFRVQGRKVQDIFYNIYRDGVLIAPNITELSYIDKDYDATHTHTWAVKTVCPDGSGVSAPAYLTVPNCKPENAIIENKTTSFTIFPNPSSCNITITGAEFNKVEVINFLGQTVISGTNATIDVSNLNSGVYFVRITTGNGTAVQKFVKQ
jgi:hypothetical protein